MADFQDLYKAYLEGRFSSRYEPLRPCREEIVRRGDWAAGVERVARGMFRVTGSDVPGRFWEVVASGIGQVSFPGYEKLGPHGAMLVVPAPHYRRLGTIKSVFAWDELLGFRGAVLLYDPDGAEKAKLGLMFRLPEPRSEFREEGFVAVTISTTGEVRVESRVPVLVEGAIRSACLGLTGGTGYVARPMPAIRYESGRYNNLEAALQHPGVDWYLVDHLPELESFYVQVAGRLPP